MDRVHRYHWDKIKFLLAGGWNTVFGYTVFAGLYFWLSVYGISYQSVFLIAQIPTVTSSFLVYKFFVFKTSGGTRREYIKFILTYCLMAGVNLALLSLFVEYLLIPVLISQGLSTVLIIILSYIINKHFTFRVKGNTIQNQRLSYMECLMSNNISERLISIESAISRIANKINRSGPVFLVIFMIAYLLMTLYRAERKLFWFDEIFTLYISRLPDFQSVMEALKHGVDFNPPLFYVWVRFSEIFFGDDALGVRMPSIIGIGLLCLCLYRFVRIRTTVIGGAVASLFPLVTGALFFSYEARPHGIVIGLAGLALVCWQSAVDPLQAKRRFWWLTGLTIALVCATLTHAYAVVIFVPLALGEIVRSYTRKRIDFAVWVAFAISSISMLVPIWLMHIVKQTVPATFSPPKFMMVAESYWTNLHYGTIYISFACALFLCKGLFAGPLRAGEISLNGLRKFELAACLGFIAVPFIVYLLSMVTGTPLMARYSLTCVLGFSALLGVLVSGNSTFGLSSIVLLIVLIAGDFMIFKGNDLIHEPSSSQEVSTNYTEYFKIMEDATDQLSPIVIFGSWDFSPVFYYAPANLRSRLIVLYWTKPDFFQESYLHLQDCCHAVGQFAEANDFIKTHKNFLVAVGGMGGINALQHFSKLGAEITLQQANGRSALFSVGLP